jgi:hypothetical protein
VGNVTHGPVGTCGRIVRLALFLYRHGGEAVRIPATTRNHSQPFRLALQAGGRWFEPGTAHHLAGVRLPPLASPPRQRAEEADPSAVSERVRPALPAPR